MGCTFIWVWLRSCLKGTLMGCTFIWVWWRSYFKGIDSILYVKCMFYEIISQEVFSACCPLKSHTYLTVWCITFQNGQTHFKNFGAFAERFLKCDWPLRDVIH